MSVFHENMLIGASGQVAAGGISRSIRLNAPDSAYLSRTPASAGNRKTWTWAGWVKLVDFPNSVTGSTERHVFFSGSSTTQSATTYFRCVLRGDNVLSINNNTDFDLTTTRIFRDFSAWYHLVVAFDTTQTTASNRLKLYVNGIQETAFSTATYPAQDTDYGINQTAYPFRIGSEDVRRFFNGYLADVYFIDGQALTPSSFTETDATTGQLIPKAFTGSYNVGSGAVNGFHLEFADNSAATATTLGKDTSGNSNNWTVNNISVTEGTGSYVANYTASAGFQASAPAINAFDGNTSTRSASENANSTVTFSPSPGITVTDKIEVWTRDGTITVNGGSGYTSSSSAAWKDVSSVSPATPFTLTSLVVTGTPSNAGEIFAIRIDGNLLIDRGSVTAAGNDSLVDVPTNGAQTDTGVGGEVRGNYCTWNPLSGSLGTRTLSNGNLDTSNSANGNTYSTFELSSGKWYFEATLTAISGSAAATFLGLTASSGNRSGDNAQNLTPSVAYCADGTKIIDAASTSYGATYTTNDVIGVAVDLDAGSITFYKNGSSQGSISKTFAGAGKGSWAIFTVAASSSASNSWSFNAGARSFAYTAPSGFKALCTANLPSTTIITSGSYTGNGVADGPFVYLNGVPTAMTVGGNAVTFGTHADKLSNGFKIRTTSTTYNQNASTYSYSITTTGDAFKYARAQSN